MYINDKAFIQNSNDVSKQSGISDKVEPKISDPSIKRSNQFMMAGSGIGFAMGVGYAFYKQTGFWKGWGIAIIGSITVAGLSRGVGYLTTKN